MQRLVFILFLALYVKQMNACEWSSIGTRRPFGFGTKTIYAPSWSPLGECRSLIVGMNYTPFKVFNPDRLQSPLLVHAYSGRPFSDGAVFCRMENHFLTRYSIKFSIHAGGYREQ